mgnify:CR=1 FL=1
MYIINLVLIPFYLVSQLTSDCLPNFYVWNVMLYLNCFCLICSPVWIWYSQVLASEAGITMISLFSHILHLNDGLSTSKSTHDFGMICVQIIIAFIRLWSFNTNSLHHSNLPYIYSAMMQKTPILCSASFRSLKCIKLILSCSPCHRVLIN